MRQGSRPPIVASYNSVNEIVEFDGVRFRYDANGNVVEDFRGFYQWDAENRLIRIDYKAGPAYHEGETDEPSGRNRRGARACWPGTAQAVRAEHGV